MFNIDHRDAVNISTYLLMKNSPATSYVAATFHPTIGQLAHQSLIHAATPELGMIPQGLRVNCRLIHSQGAQTAIQHNWVSQAFNRQAKPAQSKAQPLHTSSKTTSFTALWWRHKQQGGNPKPKWGTTQPAKQLRAGFGPNVAKTTQLQPKQGTSAAQTHNEQ